MTTFKRIICTPHTHSNIHEHTHNALAFFAEMASLYLSAFQKLPERLSHMLELRDD